MVKFVLLIIKPKFSIYFKICEKCQNPLRAKVNKNAKRILFFILYLIKLIIASLIINNESTFQAEEYLIPPSESLASTKSTIIIAQDVSLLESNKVI